MKSRALIGLLILGSLAAACGDDPPTAPSPTSSSVTFTAALQPSSEVPPITGTEANGSGTATLKFNLTKDSAGNVTAATMDATVSVTGFPAGTALTASHIHPGATGANGGVLVSLGLAAGEVTFATGSGSFTKQGVTVPVDQANSILANPAGFYLNIHTAANPGGVARGQLTRQ
jgi:CHRD domain